MNQSELEEKVMERIKVSNEPDKLVVVGFTNRTNTGALATCLGRSPIESGVTRHIQPIKALARRIEGQSSTRLIFLKDVLEIDGGTHLVKETIGPKLNIAAEWMDPLAMLQKAGVPPQTTSLVLTFRDPIDTVMSWKRMWEWNWKNFPFTAFNLSHQKTLEWWKRSERQGITVTPYIHEFVRHLGAKDTIEPICHRIGLPFSKTMIQWDDDDAYWTGRLVKYDEPPNAWVEGARGKAQGGRGGIIWEPPKVAAKPFERLFITANVLPSIRIYNWARLKAAEMLSP